MSEDYAEAALQVDALIEAIPGASAWDAVRMADELFDILIAMDAIPPEIEASIAIVLG